ncbi:Hypothetical protein AKI40_0078 [Enterobacter sp. FY-07]|uniref:tail fiber protein n=1 Tax=Kosakonia oryzendophytica TaxID=1005665 RepID=UPI000776C6CF|nr:tail fiber protein [Kosakonia oryzendophytica]AMO46509.1 Hypothetical protein AKI40_0078 [Enterobacter sp. FY-07]WBT58303.1 tail fiber protein [Kosakonia oryzendophytica]
MADTKKLQSPDALKARFKAGSIPLQSDFADLIDLANAGAVAAGQAAGQVNNAGVGMRYGSTGKLELNVKSSFNFNSDNDMSYAMQLSVDSSNNKPVVDLAYGLTGTSDGLSVKASTGIVVDNNGVSVDAGIIANATAGAKAVGQFTGQDGKPGLGMRITSAGKLEPDLDPFDFSSVSDGQGVSPIRIDTSTNKMVVDINQGLSASTNGLSVKPSTGIKVDTNGVSVDMAYVVPKGIIVMFSGTAAPTGWAFCDGSNGTPDLRDRFIKGSQTFTKSTGGTKQNSYTPTGTITIDEHTLTVAEMPSHSHRLIQKTSGNYGNGYFTPYAEQGPAENLSYIGAFWSGWLENTGGGKGHNHTGSFNGNVYYQNNEPQYFALAFIMKL